MTRFLIALFLSCGLTLSAYAQDDEKQFGGFFLGGEAGVDDEGEFFAGGIGGYRYQTDSNWVFGAELGLGSYVSSGQLTIANATLQAGRVFGKDRKTLVYFGAGRQAVGGNNFSVGAMAVEAGADYALTDTIMLRLKFRSGFYSGDQLNSLTTGVAFKF